jgi:hypothetical protein
MAELIRQDDELFADCREPGSQSFQAGVHRRGLEVSKDIRYLLFRFGGSEVVGT